MRESLLLHLFRGHQLFESKAVKGFRVAEALSVRCFRIYRNVRIREFEGICYPVGPHLGCVICQVPDDFYQPVVADARPVGKFLVGPAQLEETALD